MGNHFNGPYYRLYNGRLESDDGLCLYCAPDGTPAPLFDSRADAERWLRKHDICGSVETRA